MDTEQIAAVRHLTRQFIEAEAQGVVGHLRQGELLSAIADVSPDLITQRRVYDEEAGMNVDGTSKFPGEAMRSSLRATHKSWVVDAGLGYDTTISHPDFDRPMSLRTLKNFSALRSLNLSVTADNMPKLLAFLHNYPWKVVSRVARHIPPADAHQVIDSFRGKTFEEIMLWGDRMGGRPEPEVKSLALPAAVYDSYVEETVPRLEAILTRVNGYSPHGTSRSAVFEFMRYVTELLPDEWLEGAGRDAYGAHDEASYTEWVKSHPFKFDEPREVN